MEISNADNNVVGPVADFLFGFVMKPHTQVHGQQRPININNGDYTDILMYNIGLLLQVTLNYKTPQFPENMHWKQFHSGGLHC